MEESNTDKEALCYQNQTNSSELETFVLFKRKITETGLESFKVCLILVVL